ncbi:MAG: recombinase family protein [Richelia sp. SM1_7_0]|nr:recombinase family protein [Richelia sp. SM1_7_0]
MATIYGYARVSTQEQAVEYDALKQQIKRLEDAGAEVVLFDIESGRSDTRKKFNELLKLISRGKVKEVIITRVDRLGRSTISLGQTMRLMEKHNVKLRILDAPVDISSPFGWLSINQMAGLAEFESRLLSQRTRHGMAYFREQKKLQRAPFSYKLTDDYKLIVDENLREICRGMIEKLMTGYTVRAVSKWLFEEHNIKFSNPGIRHWVNNPAILGHTRYFTEMEHRRNKDNPRPPVIYYNTHEAIATDEEIAVIKLKIKGGSQFSHKRDKNYPLKGQLRCAECGGGMHRICTKYKTGTQYVRCSKHYQGNQFCTHKKQHRLDYVIKEVIDLLIIEANKIIAEMEPGRNEQIISDELKKLRNDIAGLKALNSDNPAIISTINDLENQAYAEEQRLKILEKR